VFFERKGGWGGCKASQHQAVPIVLYSSNV